MEEKVRREGIEPERSEEENNSVQKTKFVRREEKEKL